MDYEIVSREHFAQQLRALIGQPMLYAIKSPDILFFDLEFGDRVYTDDTHQDWLPQFVIHADCNIVIRRLRPFWEVTFCAEDSNASLQQALDLEHNPTVKRIILGEENTLTIGFSDMELKFIPWTNHEESWRLFCPRIDKPHYVASSDALWVE